MINHITIPYLANIDPRFLLHHRSSALRGDYVQQHTKPLCDALLMGVMSVRREAAPLADSQDLLGQVGVEMEELMLGKFVS